MELIGTQFNLTLGSWRLHLHFAVEDVVEEAPPPSKPPHRLYVAQEAAARATRSGPHN